MRQICLKNKDGLYGTNIRYERKNGNQVKIGAIGGWTSNHLEATRITNVYMPNGVPKGVQVISVKELRNPQKITSAEMRSL